MNKTERLKAVSAMEFLARQINNEEIVYNDWLMLGVADGDIPYGENCEDEYYIDDEVFSDLMDTFLFCMSKAYKDGGLYCDGIVSGTEFKK